jgi:hypothetical protein
VSKDKGLVFYEASHRYRLDGQWVPSVTGILGVLDKPALIKWAAGLVAEFVADNPDGVETLRRMGRGPLVKALSDLPDSTKKTAGKRGNILHDYAEELLHGCEVEVAEEHIPVMESALAFMEAWHIEPLLVERSVASRKDRWAGTFDLIADYTRPDTGHKGTAIFDWKSGKALYPEYVWQLNAYAHAEFYNLLVDGEAELPACDAAFGVQIREDGYTVAPFEFGPHIYDEFVTIRQTYDIAKRGRGDWKRPGSGYVGIPIVTEASA